MNRLRFRVWDKEEKKFVDYPVYFNLINSEIVTELWYGYEIQIEEPLQDSNYIVQQSTGLLDKNGKEIFEGDIVKNEINEVGYIEWSKCRFNFCDSVGHFYLFSIGARQPFEILGNIYEHPNLLGEE